VVKVINAGFYTTIQDLGRFGFQKHGVPVSGAIDNYSSRMANALLGNKENDALLEITMSGPTLQFNKGTFICITGASMNPKLNLETIKQNHAVKVNPGDMLSFGKLVLGFRSYIAVSGGFQTEMIMNSRSMYVNITAKIAINNGDELQITTPSNILERTHSSIKVNANHFITKNIEVNKGPEFDKLSKKQQKLLFYQDFTISKDNNRMAYQLVETLTNTLKPIITSLVLPGTVQLTPSGKLIVLMRDCQATGGYPRVLQLSESAINILAQKFTGNIIHFKIKE
jgi:biotin-dependent carboxylase-like uncharacterized protein